MGRRGPAPTPTAIKRARGETRPSEVNLDEPILPAGAPRMPSGMDDTAKMVWQRVMKAMGPTEVIKLADSDVLRCYCEAMSRYIQAGLLLRATGFIGEGQRGEMVKSPLHQVVRDNADLVRQFARELGLSPSARVGLHMDIGQKQRSFTEEIGLSPLRRLRAVGDDD